MPTWPAQPKRKFLSALVHFELNRVPESLNYFEKALALRPNEPEFLEMAGRCYIHQGDFQKAIDYLEKAKAGYRDGEKIKFLEEMIAKLKEQIKK